MSVQSGNPGNSRQVSFRQACRYWLKLGFISFGGPAGQISIMHQELVETRRWISENRFLHALNYCMLLPGPEAQQLATYIGWLLHGIRGGLVAGLLFVLPSFFILAGLGWLYLVYAQVPLVAGILYGIKPAVTAIVLFAAWRIGSRALQNNALRTVALAALIAIFYFKVPFPYIVLTAAIVGMIGARVAPDKFRSGGAHATAQKTFGPALIDDTTPLPAHACFKWSRFTLYAVTGLAIWAGAMWLLAGHYGWEGTLTRMGWFFTKAALLTFGGAYAVLPYVYQGGVEHYGWLTATQMIDGLALGETTPGPLIMIVTFVGFIGGWTRQLFGSDALLLAAFAGAGVATFFTFLPSFLFILIGAPVVEATRHELKFTAPLTAVTAAVVGVIVNLALFFAWHVFWPQGFDGPFESFAALLGLLALTALISRKAGVIAVIAACGAAGMAYWLLI
jgi:chromate transporter